MRDPGMPFKMPGSDSPLKSNSIHNSESISVTGIIHGTDSKPNNRYYVDCTKNVIFSFVEVQKRLRLS